MGLDRSSVLDAGARVVAADGLDGLGVRSVAAELGVTPMALYRHVDGADDLHDAVVHRLLATLPHVADEGAWDDRCRRWAHDLRAALAPHPGLPRFVLLHWTALPPVLRAVDGLARMLGDEGPDGLDVVAATNAVFAYVLARAQIEQELRRAGVDRDLHVLAGLAREAPFLWAHREEYAVARVDEHFAFGLDALLAGVAGSSRGSGRARP